MVLVQQEQHGKIELFQEVIQLLGMMLLGTPGKTCHRQVIENYHTST
ncbi:MAG: hypothetical protein Q8O99_01375 [bacterium]|nr:hypothetical protein [bacterium]